MRPTTIATAILAAALWSGGRLQGQDGPLPQSRPPEFGIAAGWGTWLHFNPGPSEEHQFVFNTTVGFRLSPRIEFVSGAFCERYLSPAGYYAGIMPAGGRVYLGHGGLVPYVGLGLGFGWTDLTPLLEISRRFNFRVEATAGLRGCVTDRSAWTFEARLAHTSNGGSAFPNFGLNSVELLAGWRFR